MPEIAERVATIEANYAAIGRRADDHEHNDAERFERTLNFVQTMKEEILNSVGIVSKQVASVQTKVDTLWDDKNKREGAFGLSKILAGSIGGGVALIFEWAIRR